MKRNIFLFSIVSLIASFSLVAQEEIPSQYDMAQPTNKAMPEQKAMPQNNNAVSPQEQMPQSDMAKPLTKILWITNYKDAVTMAKRDNKPLFLFFTGSDWCAWCKKMENEIFSTTEFAKKVGDRLVFVTVDFPMNKQIAPELKKQNQELKQRFGISGYPTVIILDPNENFIAETGYRPGGGSAYADYVISLLP